MPSMDDLSAALNHLDTVCQYTTELGILIPRDAANAANYPANFNANPTHDEAVNLLYTASMKAIRKFCNENDIVFFEIPGDRWQVQFTQEAKPQLTIIIERSRYVFNPEQYCRFTVYIEKRRSDSAPPIQLTVPTPDEEELKINLQYMHRIAIDWVIGHVNADGIRVPGPNKSKITQMCTRRNWYMEDNNCMVYIYPLSTTTTDKEDVDRRLWVMVLPSIGSSPTNYFYSLYTNQTNIRNIIGNSSIFRETTESEDIENDMVHAIEAIEAM